MFESFSTNALTIIDEALKIARSMNKKLVGTEHLLLALYKKKDTICHFLLEEKGITYNDIENIINSLVIFRKYTDDDLTYTNKFQEIILYSETLSKDLSSKYVYDEHIFYVLLKEEDTVASIIFEKLKLDKLELMGDIEEIFNFFGNKVDESPYPFLINLSSLKKIHPFIKRKDYIDKIKYILSKKQKNNPLLIGNAGVGKTAIIEGLSEILKNEVIYQLDLGLIVSGTKYRGELEEKLTKAMEFVKKNKAIIFIDEIHNIVGAGSNDGSLDIANILKPYLSRSDIKMIGSTTLEEYYKYIDKDKALTRRFQNIYIEEPSDKETYKILWGIKKNYEEFHNVKYNKNIINRIINICNIYLPNKTFPDKAIDLMDEIGSRKRYRNKKLEELLEEVIEDTIGIKILNINKLKSIKLNYPSLKINYYKFINRENVNIEQNNLGIIYVEKEFNCCGIIDDLNKVFGFNKEMYLEINLEDYQDITSLNNLIGSSKGYVGYEQGGILSEHIIKYPMTLIYFKNFNKANYIVKNFIKGLFEKNFIVDNKSRKIWLNNTLYVISDFYDNYSKTGFLNEKENKYIDVLKSINNVIDYSKLEDLAKKYSLNINSYNKKEYLYDEVIKKILELE